MSAGDEVTCAVLRPRVALVGTKMGRVFCIDVGGTSATVVASQTPAVQCISVDNEARYCAYGTADGRISVVPVVPDASEPWVFEHGPFPALSVALCPDYSASSSQESSSVCAGSSDGRLVMHRHNLFGRHSLVHCGEGAVTGVCWRGALVAWCNDRGVKMFNATSGQKVTFIPKPEGGREHRCLLAWASDERFFAAWGRVVKIATLVEQGEGTGIFYAEVQRQFEAEATVCGLAPLGAQNTAVLTCHQDSHGEKVMLHLCGATGNSFHSTPVPTLRDVRVEQLHLAFVAPHIPMCVASPKNLVFFQAHDLLEHTVWLLDNGKADEAIRLANGGGAEVPGLSHIVCMKSVVPELRANRFEAAVVAICKFKGLEAQTWQECISLFDQFGGLQYLAVNLPVPPQGLQLPREVYDSVLSRLVATSSALRTVLQWWPPDVFSVEDLQKRLREMLPDLQSELPKLSSEDRWRAEAFSLLEASKGNYAESAKLLIRLMSSEVFTLLKRTLSEGQTDKLRTEMTKLAEDNLQRLWEIDECDACVLFVDHHTVVPVTVVVGVLQRGRPRWVHEYLKRLFQRDEVAGQQYHMLMVRLFAEYEPKGLLSFLKASERYPLVDALGVCQQRGLDEEEAYLLGRSGRTLEALTILLERLGDVSRAVSFASEYQDPRLWEALVSFILDHPKLLVSLLECLEVLDSGSTVGQDSGRPQPPPTATPVHVLRRLPPGTKVRSIAPSVQRIFDSFELHVSLHQSCTRLLDDEMLEQKKTFLHNQNHGCAVSPKLWRCSFCGRLLGSPPPEYGAMGAVPTTPKARQPDGTPSPILPRSSEASGSSSGMTDSPIERLRRAGQSRLDSVVILGRCAFHESCRARQQLEIQSGTPRNYADGNLQVPSISNSGRNLFGTR